MAIIYKNCKELPAEQVLPLYRALQWSAAEKPDRLLKALAGSHSVVTAWHGDRLVGLGNTLSDGFLVVYYSHMCVHPDFQGRGIGREIAERLKQRYADFHQHSVLADGEAVGFYEKLGFAKPGACQALWIYNGHDHDL
ncbi:MAG: GNAT family N-acetyltransferase [Planctomycetes bacterium]|nr:GNAT family N-acetyltransferase [Planctomycetota bacterium]